MFSILYSACAAYPRNTPVPERRAAEIYAATEAVAHLVPNKQQLTGFLQLLYATVVEPHLQSMSRVMQQCAGYVVFLSTLTCCACSEATCNIVITTLLFSLLSFSACPSRQVIRWDATFRVQSRIRAVVGTQRVRVSTCVLTVTGQCLYDWVVHEDGL